MVRPSSWMNRSTSRASTPRAIAAFCNCKRDFGGPRSTAPTLRPRLDAWRLAGPAIRQNGPARLRSLPRLQSVAARDRKHRSRTPLSAGGRLIAITAPETRRQNPMETGRIHCQFPKLTTGRRPMVGRSERRCRLCLEVLNPPGRSLRGMFRIRSWSDYGGKSGKTGNAGSGLLGRECSRASVRAAELKTPQDELLLCTRAVSQSYGGQRRSQCLRHCRLLPCECAHRPTRRAEPLWSGQSGPDCAGREAFTWPAQDRPTHAVISITATNRISPSPRNDGPRHEPRRLHSASGRLVTYQCLGWSSIPPTYVLDRSAALARKKARTEVRA